MLKSDYQDDKWILLHPLPLQSKLLGCSERCSQEVDDGDQAVMGQRLADHLGYHRPDMMTAKVAHGRGSEGGTMEQCAGEICIMHHRRPYSKFTGSQFLGPHSLLM